MTITFVLILATCVYLFQAIQTIMNLFVMGFGGSAIYNEAHEQSMRWVHVGYLSKMNAATKREKNKVTLRVQDGTLLRAS